MYMLSKTAFVLFPVVYIYWDILKYDIQHQEIDFQTHNFAMDIFFPLKSVMAKQVGCGTPCLL